ncbi:MAG: twin-arginine translocase subunit TatC [Minisyncoccia bacterium]
MTPRPAFLKELNEMSSLFIRFAFVLAGVALLMFLGTPPLVMQLFAAVKAALLPTNVSIVALSPWAPFVAQFTIAFMVAFVVSFPYLLWSLMRYILPALYPAERRTVSSLFYFALLLFFSGCIFAYTLLIPSTFSILYSFAGPLGVTPLFSLDSFIWTVFNLTVFTGVTFLLPVLMFLLSATGIVPARWWRAHWRGAVVIITIFSAIITPDGTGVTMVLLSVPLLLLYGTGVVLSARREKKREPSAIVLEDS